MLGKNMKIKPVIRKYINNNPNINKVIELLDVKTLKK